MDEILPGVMHWSAVHPNTDLRSHSAFHVESGTLIDPMVPEEGLEWFERHRPRRALLTNRHHLRGAPDFAAAFGCSIHCHPAGLHEFEGGPDVGPMEPGDPLARGITVLEFGAITPEEVARNCRRSRCSGAPAYATGASGPQATRSRANSEARSSLQRSVATRCSQSASTSASAARAASGASAKMSVSAASRTRSCSESCSLVGPTSASMCMTRP
jgi:hypothetical protein